MCPEDRDFLRLHPYCIFAFCGWLRSYFHFSTGFEVLTEIQNIMAADTLTAERKDSALKDASNRFFTLIPAIDPHVISTDEELRSKVTCCYQ